MPVSRLPGASAESATSGERQFILETVCKISFISGILETGLQLCPHTVLTVASFFCSVDAAHARLCGGHSINHKCPSVRPSGRVVARVRSFHVRLRSTSVAARRRFLLPVRCDKIDALIERQINAKIRHRALQRLITTKTTSLTV